MFTSTEGPLATRTQIARMKKVLGELSQRDREILMRFYLREQTKEQICAEMALSETQFQLLKSRARTRFSDLRHDSGLRSIVNTPVPNFKNTDSGFRWK